MKREKRSNVTWQKLIGVLLVIVALALVGITSGCDDTTSESTLEDARAALDKGQYQEALNILINEATSDDVQEIRADAYAGLVGVSTLDVLTKLDENDDSKDGSIDRIGMLLGAKLSCTSVAVKVGDIRSAILSVESTTDTNDNRVRLGIYGMTDMILLFGMILCDEYSPDTITLTEVGIRELRNSVGGNFSSLGSSPMVTQARIDHINTDIGLIRSAADVLGADNDLGDEFQAFLAEIDLDSSGDLSSQELADYLSKLGNS